MLKHHQESIGKLIDYFADNPRVLAIVLGGSVAKGLERPDSDIDAAVIVTDDYYDELAKADKQAECIFGLCTYEHGYFDIKYYTKGFLTAAAERGSEPTRNAFVKSRSIFSRDDEIEGIVSRIGVFQEAERQPKMDSFYSALSLSYGYFWRASADNPYLRLRCVSDIMLYAYRLLLEHSRVLFPCHKSLVDTVAALPKKPEGIIAKGERMLSAMDDDAVRDFVESILGFIDYQPPKDYAQVLTTFIEDNELWWYKGRPVIAEW